MSLQLSSVLSVFLLLLSLSGLQSPVHAQTCEIPNPNAVGRFCQQIEYPVFVPAGSSLEALDFQARTLWVTGSAPYDSALTDQACCNNVYKDWVCSTSMAKCANTTISPLNVCANYVCTASIEANINLIEPCFAVGCDSSGLTENEDCTCPRGGFQNNSACFASDDYECLYGSAPSLPICTALLIVSSAFVVFFFGVLA
eukprot:CAMPEP_0174230302 /NCGR_PEP_ID=MMETSP0417-20130205/1078_1 /TAXON_ID=242541 /ORGANISM="Mayorella sp, Strain BSH-02190019" /LENGTH=198 /DNA_ID=CAMNT_0015307955 /DNA_START=59 /DNA_END=655 /DNA_ORIENTATION=-